jgi:hypothetical protein
MPSSSTSSPELVPVASLQDFFRQAIDDALASNHVAVDQHTAYYVVNLLTLFSRAEAFHDEPEGPRLRPLSLLLHDAVEAGDPASRHQALRRLGDVALFVAGFLADGLHRTPVGVDYYVRMGGGAYQTLSTAMPHSVRGRTWAPVFAELSAKFQDLVDVLNEVRSAVASDADVLRLYELWLKTGSRRAARLLQRLGVAPVAQTGSIREH